MDLLAVLGSTEATLQLVDHRFEGGVEAVCGRFGSGHRAFTSSGDLDALATLGLSSVAFMLQFHVEVEYGGVEVFESRQLFRNVDSEVIGDLDISSLDYDVGSRSCGILGTLDGGVLDEKRGLRRGRHSYLPITAPPHGGRRQILQVPRGDPPGTSIEVPPPTSIFGCAADAST